MSLVTLTFEHRCRTIDGPRECYGERLDYRPDVVGSTVFLARLQCLHSGAELLLVAKDGESVEPL